MAYMICDRFHTGPNCTDNRKEKAGPLKEDCLRMAILDGIKQIYQCRREILDEIDKGVYIVRLVTKDDKPLDDLKCFRTLTTDQQLQECYCTGFSGLTCTVCNGQDAGSDFGGEEEEIENDVGTGVDIQELTTSSTDVPIPITYGTVFLTGNIIWISDVRTVTKTEKKGKKTTRTTIPVIDFALGLAEGTVGEILRLWVGDRLVIDKTAAGSGSFNKEMKDAGFSIDFWNGSEGQLLNPTMDDGYGRTPAYRGLSYVMLKNFPIATAGSSLPPVRVEVTTQSEKGGATWDESDVESDHLSVDYVSGRTLTTEDGELIVRRGTSEYAVTTESDPYFADFTTDGAIVYQGENFFHYIRQDNYNHEFTVPTDPSDDLIASVAALTTTDGTKDVTPIFAYDDFHDVTYQFEVDHDAGEMTLVDTHAMTHEYLGVWAERFDRRAAAVLIGVSNSGGVAWATWSLYDDVARTAYDRTDGFIERSVSLTAYGIDDASAELVNVLRIPETTDFVLFFSGAQEYAVRVPYNTNTPVWSVVVPGTPNGKLSAGLGDTYCYFAGDVVYKMNLDTGATSEVYNRVQNGAPAVGMDQHYDATEDRINYSTAGGKIAYVYPNRILGNEVSLSYVLGSILEKTGLTPQEYDFTRLDNVLMTGYLVYGQESANTVFEELSEFFHFTVCESSNGMTASFVADPDEVDVDLASSQSFVKTRGVNAASQLQYARVGYFDTERDGSLTYQTADKDMIRDPDNALQQYDGFQYAANIYTTATPARKSAEMSLLRRLQRLDSYETVLGPRYLAIDPADFVEFSASDKGRVKKVELDVTFATKVYAEKDDPTIFEDSPELYGVTLNPTSDSIDTGSVTTFPVYAVMPPPRLISQNAKSLFFGQTTPDGNSAFQEQWISGIELNEYQAEANPSEEARVGAAMTALPYTKSQFTTQRDSQLVVKFSKSAAGVFTNATTAELAVETTRNLLIVGKEYVRFLTADVDPIFPEIVTFTGLQRGVWNTDTEIGNHFVNERVIYYTPNSMRQVRAYNDILTYGSANASIFDEERPDKVRSLRAQYTDPMSFLPKPSQLRVQKVPGTGVYLQSFGRERAFSEMLDDEYPIFTTNTPMYFILKAPYDKETFMAALYEGTHIYSTEDVVSPNSYIHRVLVTYFGTDPTRYEPSNMAIDGNTLETDIHIAVMFGLLPEAPPLQTLTTQYSEPQGFMIEGQANYAKFKSALWKE